MPPRNFNLILFAVVVSILCHLTYRNTRTASIIGEAVDLIEQNYVDPIDRRELVMAAMQGVVTKLDEHSSYFAVDAYESFQDSMHQEFAGIGIYVDQLEPESPVRVVTPLVGSPALRAGVLPNDLIVRVDGQDVSKLPLTEVSDRLKGAPGTTVQLVVRRGDQQQTIDVRRATIELESVVGDHRDSSNRWVYRLQSDPTVAYLRLKSFGEKTVQELQAVLAELDNDYQALVLDLRGNGGGLLYAARDVCDMFLSSGVIVSTRVRGGRIEESYSATAGTLVDPRIPVAVLVDGNSASASEIVAACLQDNGRAIVVGTRSYGKGTVQEIIPLEYGRSALRLTVARYYRPNNKNIHRLSDATEEDEWGVTPDPGFVVPMDMASILKLNLRWRTASYPMLAGIDPPELPIIDPDPAGTAPIQQDLAPQAIEAGPAKTPVVDPESPPESVDAGGQSPPELSAEAQAHVDRGPVELSDDPPLRAAVGALLDRLKSQSVPDSPDSPNSPAAVKRQAA
ncbi:S41 family peptidase [Stieleria sp. TO1_6]|uniref:S41 family peptidase n=1 Tax=Stieleria tagensis TaxID=2956795 RepID=UPI00209AC304|nr:S41 family peptidase [Stieleria tagensis]MCO8123741.1 S41 family peptidase [Stieleria tagensis]